MYARQFLEPPLHIIEKGKAKFGTFDDVSSSVDIRGMRAPYAGIPLPSFLSNLRIKSRLYFVFTLENYMGITKFFDFKVFGLSQVIFWHKESGKKYSYHTIMPARRRFIPINTTRGICASYFKKRFIKISWGRKHQHHALTFKLKGDSVRPNAEGYIYSSLEDSCHTDSMFVNPSPASSRCSATWFTTMSTKGHITISDKQADDSEGLALMYLNRTYFKMHSKWTFTWGLSNENGKTVYFQLENSNLSSADQDKFNNNILVVDGKKTSLPSVYITHPFGIDKAWIIQDTENMVDLTFTPISIDQKTLNVIALRTTSSIIYGTYEGTLLTKDGEKINIKKICGIINKDMLRL